MKKLIIIIGILIFSFSSFLFMYNKKIDYSLKYEVNDVIVKESYHKEEKYYRLDLEYENQNYGIITFNKYIPKRKLINDIEIRINDEKTCLNLNSKYLDTYEVCSKDNILIVGNNKVENPELIKEYQKFKLYNHLDNKYLLWNYHNFVYMDANESKEITLFKKDIYNLKSIYQYDNYLMIPNYEEDYKYSKIYTIDINNHKVKNIDLRYSIYFDSYFLGNHKNKVYIYDRKEEQEYYIDMKKARIYKTANKVLRNSKWEEISTYKLKNNNETFYNDLVYNYKLINNKLYSYILDEEYLTLISDLEVNEIVKTNGFDVYFLSKDSLYFYNPFKGLQKLMSYSEWEFNYTNMIFIFD